MDGTFDGNDLSFPKLTEFKKTDLAKQIEDAFPDAKLVDVQEGNND